MPDKVTYKLIQQYVEEHYGYGSKVIQRMLWK